MPQMVHDIVYSSYRPRIAVAKPERALPQLCFSVSATTKRRLGKTGTFMVSVNKVITKLTQNATLVLVPHDDPADRNLIQKFATSAKNEGNTRVSILDVGSRDVAKVEAAIATCDVLLTMRYHCLVLAGRTATP